MTDLHKAVLANLDALSDDAAAHIFPSDLQKCMTSECVVQVVSVRAGNPDERTVPLFSREQVEAALREAATAPSVRSIGWVAPKDTYAFPVLFNPYTGQPRDARDIQSDPQGSLLVPPGASAIAALAPGQPVQAAPKVWAYSTEDGERIVPAKTHEDAMRDGGAMASSLLPYTVPLTTLREALAAPVVPEWQPIETAPKDGRVLLLGYTNGCGKWRTVRGEWMSDDYIAENWEFPENGEAGWFETAVNCEDPPNCWSVEPTHWMPLPAAPKPKEQT